MQSFLAPNELSVATTAPLPDDSVISGLTVMPPLSVDLLSGVSPFLVVIPGYLHSLLSHEGTAVVSQTADQAYSLLKEVVGPLSTDIQHITQPCLSKSRKG